MTYSSSHLVTEDGGRQNMYAIESKPFIDQEYAGYSKEAELANGRWAMVGFIAALGSYATTGQIMPGIF